MTNRQSRPGAQREIFLPRRYVNKARTRAAGRAIPSKSLARGPNLARGAGLTSRSPPAIRRAVLYLRLAGRSRFWRAGADESLARAVLLPSAPRAYPDEKATALYI
jgi:hypothetical protein